MTAAFQLRTVQLPVEDIGTAVAFYTGTLGWSLRFRDGDRYAVLDAGGIGVALAAPAEQVVPGRPALNLKVPDVPAALETLVAAGGRVLVPPVEGAHEIRAAVADSAGNVLVVYAPRGT